MNWYKYTDSLGLGNLEQFLLPAIGIDIEKLFMANAMTYMVLFFKELILAETVLFKFLNFKFLYY